jgi:integron integrase
VGWIKRFILFHGKRHPRDMGGQEVQQFLSHLAVAGHVAASTQSQALSAVLFLYQQVLKQDIGWLDDVVRAKKPQRFPVVLTQDVVKTVLAHLSGTTWIMATLLYGAGLRLLECLRLRVKEVDFTYNQIVVRAGKGRKDRVTMLPQQVKGPLQRHLHDVRQMHEQDVQAEAGHVYLPYALERKYPNASREWIWQYVFPATRLSRDPRTGIIRRHHIHKLVLQRAVHAAVRKTNITKPASGHTLRHAWT